MKNIINSILGRYHSHSEAVIVSCFFNPTNSPYRLKAFNIFLKSIEHLEYRIIECVIGDSKPQLKKTDKITRIHTESLLWHKETLLNRVIEELPSKFKYVFWVDADVIFTNKKWIVDGVNAMKRGAKIIQPFEYCVHLEQDELEPSFDLDSYRDGLFNKDTRHASMWRSFCSNIKDEPYFGNSDHYDVHGHVGFAWGAQREVLDECPLYDKALIGGADHIIAHAATGQINHKCITKAFIEDSEQIAEWSRRFWRIVRGKIDYVKGDLYHIWHGSLEQRQYLKRIRDMTKQFKEIREKDKNGLFVNVDPKLGSYMDDYFQNREVTAKPITKKKVTLDVARAQVAKAHGKHPAQASSNNASHLVHSTDNGFANSFAIGYATNSAPLGMVMGGNSAGAILGEMMNTSEETSHKNHNHDTTPSHCDNPVHHHNHDGPDCSTNHHSSDTDTSSNFS